MICAQCGRTFNTPKSKADKGAKFCSAECFEWARHKRIQCKCEVCGKLFALRPADINEGQGKFCSRGCYSKSRITRVSLPCQECGKTFEAFPAGLKIGKGKYCSNECANRSTGRERRRTFEKCQCEFCGKTFETKQTPAQANEGKPRFCSRECFAQARKNRTEKRCEYCGNKISLTPGAIKQGRGRFCSRDCANKAYQKRIEFTCIVCGTNFELEESRVADGRGRFCSKRCLLRYRGETAIEQLMRQELEKQNEPYEPQVKFASFHVDFVLPRRRAVIECDGRYWHNKLDVFARDRRKDEYLKNLGYQVFRFSDKEIRNSPSDCIHQVLALAPVVSMVE